LLGKCPRLLPRGYVPVFVSLVKTMTITGYA